MRKFIFTLLAFGLPLYSIMLLGDYLLSERIQQCNNRKIEAWYDIMHSQIDADIVIMGNSRAWQHINPLILDSILGVKTYNLGMNGSTINRQIHKYNLFRRYNRKPKIILQNIDVWSLLYRTGYERQQFYPYFWNMNLRDEFFDSEPFSVWEKYVPMYRYRYFRPITQYPKYLIKGYRGVERHWNGLKYRKVKKIIFSPNDYTIRLFNDYLAKAKSEGIEVVLVYAPQYIGLTKKISNHAYMLDCYQQIADKYDLPILDYTNMQICKDTTYFYNAMHLNRKGAEIFSDSLACDLKRLITMRD